MNASLDRAFMQQALDEAAASQAFSSPNPTVGCVLARGGELLAAGSHLYDRRDHAEIVALRQAASRGVDLRGATAYVTLEPCSHHGRTGPCADALLSAGIARCVVATIDPNPEVSGSGVRRLRAAGVLVEIGLLQREARALNNAFAFAITERRPLVTLKSALSVDGRIAPPLSLRTPGEPYLLTGAEAREDVQRLRHRSDALLTGIGTVLADDPLLTDRTGAPRRRPLLRVVLDSRLQIPLSAKLVQSAAENTEQDLWIFCGADAPGRRAEELRGRGITIIEMPTPHRLDLAAVLHHLYRAECNSVLLEAGSGLNAAFLRQDLVDEAILYYAPLELGSAAMAFAADGEEPFALERRMRAVDRRTFGPDVRIAGLLHDPWAKTPAIL